MPAPAPHIPARYHGLWWAEDGRLSLGLHLIDPASPRAMVWGPGGVHVDTQSLSWTPHTQEDSDRPTERLDVLRLELGIHAIDPTYVLMFSIANTDPDALGGFQWVRPLPDSPLETLRLHPEYSPSFTAAMVGYWDDIAIEERASLERWCLPYSTFRLATAAEAAAHPGWQGMGPL